MIPRMAKHYDQYCPVAHALDVVGDRWALLVARELVQGPKRYTDLAEGLPGIGTNILAARLRGLELAGVITKKTLPPPAASRVYELTDYGLELKPVIRELALWGARSLGPPTADDELFPGWLVCPAEVILGPGAPARAGPRRPRRTCPGRVPSSPGSCFSGRSRPPAASSSASATRSHRSSTA